MKDSSLTLFFLVTGVSFFLFSKTLQWLDGTPLPVLTWTGIIALMMGVLISILTLIRRS